MNEEQEYSDPVVTRLVQLGRAHNNIRAMLLYSSRAQQGAKLDAYSDYDVLLEVLDVSAFFHDHRWLGDFGPVLVVFKNPLGIREGFPASLFVTQYEDGVKVDFAFVQTGYLDWLSGQARLPNDMDHGVQVLLDKDGKATSLPAPTRTAYAPSPPDEGTYRDLIAEFFNDAAYVAKALRRGDLMPAKQSLDTVMKHHCLLNMLEWRHGLETGWSTTAKPSGRGLRSRIDAATHDELDGTYVGADETENWDALWATIRLFGRVGRQVGRGLGYAYPEDLHSRVVSYLQAICQGAQDSGTRGREQLNSQVE